MAALAMLLLTHAPFRARLVRPSLQTHMQRASTLVGTAEPDGSRLCIIDAHNLAYRMYHALPVLTSRTGEPAHALLGFCNKLWKLRDVFPGYNMLCVFDEGAPARRIEMLPEYKEVCLALSSGYSRAKHGHPRLYPSFAPSDSCTNARNSTAANGPHSGGCRMFWSIHHLTIWDRGG